MHKNRCLVSIVNGCKKKKLYAYVFRFDIGKLLECKNRQIWKMFQVLVPNMNNWHLGCSLNHRPGKRYIISRGSHWPQTWRTFINSHIPCISNLGGLKRLVYNIMYLNTISGLRYGGKIVGKQYYKLFPYSIIFSMLTWLNVVDYLRHIPWLTVEQQLIFNECKIDDYRKCPNLYTSLA